MSTKKTSLRLLLALLVAAGARRTSAYDDRVVHPRMMRSAFDRALAEKDFLKPFGPDAQGKMGGHTAREWAVLGARQEDEKDRSISHFFHPESGSALVLYEPWLCLEVFNAPADARTWALADAKNAYGLQAAKRYRRLAFTAPTKIERYDSMIGMFRAVGQMSHLVQDMSQPQHTRNDAHLTVKGLPVPQYLDDRTFSRYELWCAEHLQKHASPSYFGDYPLPRFRTYADYFTSPRGHGLADYGSRNFVTEDTNYSDAPCGDFVFAAPSLDDTEERRERHQVTTYHWNDRTQTAEMTVVEYDGVAHSRRTDDDLTGSHEVNDHHTYYSYFDFELQQESGRRLYSLPRTALDAQARLLVRRGVGYSGGFVAHFFRGKLKVEGPDEIAEGRYRLILRNMSDEPITGGVVSLYYRVDRPGELGAREGEDLVRIVDDGLPSSVELSAAGRPGDHEVITIGQPHPLNPVVSLRRLELRVVIDGTLGAEPSETIGMVVPAQDP